MSVYFQSADSSFTLKNQICYDQIMKEFGASCKGRKATQTGLSVIEVLIVITMLAVLAVLGGGRYRRHLRKARDAERKSDMKDLKLAFEDYYNDHGCYPAPEVLNNCGQPLGDETPYYLKAIPCDPKTGEPYIFFSFNGNACMGVRVLADLELADDPDIETIGCDFDDGCGWDEDEDYNYGFSVGDEMMASSWQLGGTTGDIPFTSYYCIPDSGGGGGYTCSSIEYEILITEYNCPTGYDEASECEAECIDQFVEGVSCTWIYE